MKKFSSVLVSLALLLPSTGFAQTFDRPAPVRVERRSRNMAIVGGTAAGLSGVLLLATIDYPEQAGETFTLDHELYCVDSGPNRFNVDEGGCYPGGPLIDPQARPYLYGAMAAGTAMLLFGLQKVEVRPVVGRGVTGASATIRWGGGQSSSRK